MGTLELVAVARAKLDKQAEHSNKIVQLIAERDEFKNKWQDLKNTKKSDVSAVRRKKEEKLRANALQILIQKEEVLSQELRAFGDKYDKTFAFEDKLDYFAYLKEDIAARLDEGKSFLEKGLKK